MNDSVIKAEKYFVDTFIRKDRRERLWFELSHPNRRYRGLSRFCHQSTDLLRPDKILLSGKDLMRQEHFQEFVKKGTGQCLILSPDASCDGRTCPLCDAVALCMMCLDASIVVGSHFAVVSSEAMQGGSDHFLLVE